MFVKCGTNQASSRTGNNWRIKDSESYHKLEREAIKAILNDESNILSDALNAGKIPALGIHQFYRVCLYFDILHPNENLRSAHVQHGSTVANGLEWHVRN